MWFVDQDGNLVNADKFRSFFVHDESKTRFEVTGRESREGGDAFVRVAKFDNSKDANAYLARLGLMLDAVNIVGNVRMKRIAGEDIEFGKNWADAGGGYVIGTIRSSRYGQVAQNEIKKGQKCWFDPSDGKLFLEK